MLNTTLVNGVSTQNASGNVTNATKTAFSATTSNFAIAVSILNPAGPVSAQSAFRIWFDPSPYSVVTATLFANQCASPACLEVHPKNTNNGTTISQSVPVAAMGTYLYCWVEMPSITAAGGTLTVTLIELN